MRVLSAMKEDQLWRCSNCGKEYVSPVRASHVLCGGQHLTGRAMQFVSGPEPRQVTPRWKEKSKPKVQPEPEKAQPKKKGKR